VAVGTLIARYGLAAIFLGAGIEGETIVLAGGVFASRHILWLPAVVIAAAAGSFVADQGFFLIGRHLRDKPRVKRQLDKPAAEKALTELERHPNGFILGFRFLYGLRTVSPMAVGTTDIPTAKFVLLNALAAFIWACLISGIGYGTGRWALPVGRKSPSTIHLVIGIVVVLAVIAIGARIAWTIYHRRGPSPPRSR
jgi:membrane protein DedA with SNARE-associated domain